MSSNPPAPLRIVVIGGVSAGLRAARRARRTHDDATITVLEARAHLAFAEPDLVSHVTGKSRSEGTSPSELAERYRIDARVQHHVLRIDREHQQVEGVDEGTNGAFALGYDRLILAPGLAPILPVITGLDAPNVFTLQGVADAERLNAFLVQSVPVNAVVVGAGLHGLALAAALTERGLNVSVLETAARALPSFEQDVSAAVEAELARRAVRLQLSTTLRALRLGDGGEVEAVEPETGDALATDLVLLALGSRPDTALARQAGLELGPDGDIGVDRDFRSIDPHIESAGQAAPTAFSSRVARLFGLEVGRVGLGLEAARGAGYDAECLLVRVADDATLALIYERGNQRLLGAEAAGVSAVQRHLDVVATALHFEGRLTDLSRLLDLDV